MNEFIYNLDFLNLIKGSKFIETIRDFEQNRKISPIAIWKAYTIGRKTSANAVLILASLIHSLKDLYPYLEIIRLIMALYEQKLQEIIEPKVFKCHYDHYFVCLTVETREEDDKLAKSEEYKVYIEYFWKLFQWIKIELVEGHAFEILGDHRYDESEDSFLRDIENIDKEMRSMDLNVVYEDIKTDEVDFKSNQDDDKFSVNVDEWKNLNVTKVNNKDINIQNIKFMSKDDNYLYDCQLNKYNLSIKRYFSMRIDELDAKVLYRKFDLIFKKVFCYDTPMEMIIDDIFHWDKPPPNKCN